MYTIPRLKLLLVMLLSKFDIGYIPNDPLLDTNNESSSSNASAFEMTQHLKAFSLTTKDFLLERQHSMQVQTNSSRNHVEFTAGEFILLHRDAYFTGRRYLKIQSIFLGPFKVVEVMTNTVQLDFPSSFRKHRVINVKHIRKFLNDPDRYSKVQPNTSIERVNRLGEIISVVGYDMDENCWIVTTLFTINLFFNVGIHSFGKLKNRK